MKLDELRTVQSKERRKDSLQQLRDSFYEDVAAYIQDLTASRDRRAEAVDNPFSDDEVRRLSDELETAEEVAEAIYERRVGKVVKLASFAAADMPVDDEGMTAEERQLFEDLVDRISRNKAAVLDVLSGSTDTTATEQPAPTTTEPTASTTTEPPAPTTTETATATASEPDQTEPTTPSAEGMLADAMGGGGNGEAADESPVGATASPTPEATSGEAAPSAGTPPSENLPDDVPPPKPPSEMGAETRTDAKAKTDVETSTDGGTAAPSAEPTTEPIARATNDAAVDADGGDDTDDSEDRTTLRITKNVGEIFGVDGREYTLRSEDVVTLPTANAEPLVDRDAAMRLD
ncbi:MAG: hypothetical protein ACOC0Z_04630 [Halohasta sp.]